MGLLRQSRLEKKGGRYSTPPLTGASGGSASVSGNGSSMGSYTDTGLVTLAVLTRAVFGSEAGPAGSVL